MLAINQKIKRQKYRHLVVFVILMMIVWGVFIGLIQKRSIIFAKSAQSVPTDWGYNDELWAIFATDSKGCSAPEVETVGSLTFIEIDPNYAHQPPFQSYSNIHSVGSVTLGNHDPVLGQVTYQDSCTNCNNAIVEPEMTEYELSLPNFETYRELALSEADALGQHLTGDIVWGNPLTDTLPQILDNGVWYIDGSLTIMSESWLAIQRGFIYVSGDVNIDGFFYGEELSIMSAGTINILGTLRNQHPYFHYFPELFRYNKVVLWSKHDRSASGTGDPCTEPVINIETTISNENIYFSTDNDIRGTILADHGRIRLKANQMNNKVRGALIGDTILVESNVDSGAETHLQYNGLNFPYQPERIAILSLSPPTITATVGEAFEVPVILQINEGSVDLIDVHLNFDPTYVQLADISPDDYNFHILLNEFDNTSGELDLKAEYVSELRYLTLATLTFTATTEIQSTTLDFNLTPPRESDVRVLWYDEFSVLSDTIGSTIIINPAPNTPTPSSTPTVTTPTPTNQPTNTPTIVTSTPTADAQLTNTPTNQPTNSPTITIATSTPTVDAQLTNTPTNQPTNSPTIVTSTPSPSNQASHTPTPTLTSQPTNTPIPILTSQPPTPTPTTELEATALPTATIITPTSEAETSSLDNLLFVPMVVK